MSIDFTKKCSEIAVIGGGPAGLMAAGTAASYGARVILFEKKSLCGLKLMITGAGRCNITNSAPWNQFLSQYPENSKFLYPAFRTFFVDDLIAFLKNRGLQVVLEEDGKYFPATQRAKSVLDVLLTYCESNHVDIHLQEPIEKIERNDCQWLIQTSQQHYRFDAVIMATGGLSYPQTGSDGDGYRIAAELSHSIIPTRPALVALEIAQLDCSTISGISLSDISVEIQALEDDQTCQKIASQRGDLLLTHFGVSGPAVLFISRWLPSGYDTTQNQNYRLVIDLLPDLFSDDIENQLLSVFNAYPKRQVKNSVSQCFNIPQAVAEIICSSCNLAEHIINQNMTKLYRRMLIQALKSWVLPISRSRGYREAMVTAGGVSTRQVNPRTMESKIHPGLYFAGEILDIDGYTGGFNLQAAFSTGYLAGKSAAARP